MSVPLLAFQPHELALQEEVHNVVDLAWLTLAWRLKQDVARTPAIRRALDAGKLDRHLELLSSYLISVVSAGDASEWNEEILAEELKEALTELADRSPTDHAGTLEIGWRAFRLATDEDAQPGEILDLADRCFGILISLEFGTPRPLDILVHGGRMPKVQPAYHLTSREEEVLRLLALGLTYQQIAAELFLQSSTVRAYARQITDKLRLHRR